MTRMLQKKYTKRQILSIAVLVCVGVMLLIGLNFLSLYMQNQKPMSEEGQKAYVLAEQEFERNFPEKKFDSDLTYVLEFSEEGANGVWEFRYTPKSPLGGMVLDADVSVYVDLSTGTATLEQVGGT
jgi:hypothetical protein